MRPVPIVLLALLLAGPAAAQVPLIQTPRADLEAERWRAQADAQAAAAAQAQADVAARLGRLQDDRRVTASPPPAPDPRAPPDPRPADAGAQDRVRETQRRINEIDAWLAAQPRTPPPR